MGPDGRGAGARGVARRGARVHVRPVTADDADAWLALRGALWPGSAGDHAAEIEAYFADPPDTSACLVAETSAHGIVGFAEVGVRSHAEECRSSPVGYLEGIYVKPAHRTAGVGRALVLAGERWARGAGCTEMASDRELANEGSGAFHEALGFEESGRIVCYRKAIPGVASAPGVGSR